MNAKQETWEELKDETVRLHLEIGYAGKMQDWNTVKYLEAKYVKAHKEMRAFAKRNGLLGEYEAWIS